MKKGNKLFIDLFIHLVHLFLKPSISFANKLILTLLSFFSSTRHVTLEHEVACLDITPLQEGAKSANIVAVGLWTDITARILRLPNLDEVNRESLGGGMSNQS